MILVGWIAYYFVVDVIERFSELRIHYDQTAIVSAMGAVSAFGLVCGAMAGFFIVRRELRYVEQYLFLFIFGVLISVAFSVVQYRTYLADIDSFAFSSEALAKVGEEYSSERRASLVHRLEFERQLKDTADRLVSMVQELAAIRYLDPAEEWDKAPNCRRLDLGNLQEDLCVRNEKFISPGAGLSSVYWPVLRSNSYQGARDAGYQIDLFLLTGKYRCPVRNDFTGGGGFNFLRFDPVDAAKLRACLGVAAMAFADRARAIADELRMLESATLMPYWYFVSSAVFSFVGSDFALVKPVGFWPVALGASLAVFRFLFFALLVTLIAEPALTGTRLSHRPP